LKERIMNTLPEPAALQARSKPYPWKVVTAATAAALLIVATSLGVWYAQTGGNQPLTAFRVLGQAAYAMANFQTVHIKATLRTHPGENFAFIDLKSDPVPIELWREAGKPGRWRLQNPGRVVVMDGQRSVLWIPKAKLTNEAPPGGGAFIEWFAMLMEPDTLLEREMKTASEDGSSLTLTRETGPTGAEELVVSIDSAAKGDFSQSDYARDYSIDESDNLRIYRFDADTKRLTGLQIYVHQPKGDVLVFETQSVAYDEPMDDSLFALDIPADAVGFVEPKVAGAVPEASTPEGAARAFFEACATEDWDRLRPLGGYTAIPDWLKNGFGGLQIISIGKPFRSGNYPGYFVPYEIRLKDGSIRKHNMAVRNDNPAKQYVEDGGI
jgi:hypothetical protein